MVLGVCKGNERFFPRVVQGKFKGSKKIPDFPERESRSSLKPRVGKQTASEKVARGVASPAFSSSSAH